MTELVQGTRTFVRDDAPKPRVEVVAAFALLGAAYLQGWVGAAPRRTAALRGANVAAWELPCQTCGIP